MSGLSPPKPSRRSATRIDLRHAITKPKTALMGGFIRVSVATAVPALLREFDLEPESVLAATDVNLRLLQDPDNIIPFSAMGRLLSVCAERTGCSHFGLLVGLRGNVSSLGTLGLLLRQAPDVGSALRDLEQYMHLHDRGAVPKLEVRDGVATLAYVIFEPAVTGAEQIADGALAVGLNIMRGLCGADWLPSEVHLPRRKPSDPQPLRRAFRAPIRFDQEYAALVFPAYWLDRPLSDTDPALRRHFEDYVRQLEAGRTEELSDELRRVLRTLLHNGQCSADRVAQLFSINRRTLNRWLKQEGTSFHLLLDETRFQIARQMLSDTEIPLAQIAAVLNYSEASAFTRAFRRWSGLSPTAWRARRRSG